MAYFITIRYHPVYTALNSTAGASLLTATDTRRVSFDQAILHYTTQQDESSVRNQTGALRCTAQRAIYYI